jgi:hypothetical protein
MNSQEMLAIFDKYGAPPGYLDQPFEVYDNGTIRNGFDIK